MKTNSNSITNSSFKYGTVADWVYVYRQYIPDKVLASDLEVELTINDDGTERTQIVKLYDIIRMANSNQEIVAIPRYCPFANTLYLQNKVLDYTTNGADIDISIKVPPRNHYQQEAINAMLSNEHGIISCKTAFGKTYCAINAICQLKKRALILMHKRELMKQWKEDFLKYTDLTEDDIQIFTGDKFQSGKAVTITTVQNICAKIRSHNFANREAFNNENFGITIFDECHTTVGPLANTQASRWCFSKRIYGLSATPERGDGLDKVINYIIGNVIYKDNRKLLPVFVSFSPVALHIPQKTCYYLTRSTMQYTIRYNKYLCKDNVYIDHCAEIIECLMNHNKKILVVAAYKELLETVYYRVVSHCTIANKDISAMKLIHGTSEEGLDSIKSMSQEEIEKFHTIFSTSKFFSDGISIDWLDTIVYVTSPSSKSLSAIPQLVGRIVREYKGKKYVNVIDIFNSESDIEVGRKYKRMKAYDNLHYNILNEDSYDPEELIANTLSQCEWIIESETPSIPVLEE